LGNHYRNQIVTDDMVKTLMKGGGVRLEGYLLNLKDGPFSTISRNILQAVSDDGQKAFEMYMTDVSQELLKRTIKRLLSEINSRKYISKSVYKNGIRLDTEYRCQNQKCKPNGKQPLLFKTSRPIEQPIQIKCKCGWINTFWKNRIDFDDQGALYMKTTKSNGSDKREN